MQAYDLYKDIAERTQGDVYIGIVGPVRTGKSTFIQKFMEKLVIPAIDNAHIRARAQDDLPQSGSGRMIMTTKPAFVPSEAVEIALPSDSRVRLRLIDSVGYLVEGALGTCLLYTSRAAKKKVKGLEDFHFHTLRHTYTSNLLRCV